MPAAWSAALHNEQGAGSHQVQHWLHCALPALTAATMGLHGETRAGRAQITAKTAITASANPRRANPRRRARLRRAITPRAVRVKTRVAVKTDHGFLSRGR